MKYDVYIDNDTAKVYPRNNDLDQETAELPKDKPLFSCPADSDDWFNWCDTHSLCTSDSIRKCELCGYYPEFFLTDTLKKAQNLFDEYRKGGEFLGWGKLEIDLSYSHTYRRSAAWKDEPTYYNFDQALKWTDKNANITFEGEALRVRDKLVQLWGMSDALYELGLSLVYTNDFKLHIFGVKKGWKTQFVF